MAAATVASPDGAVSTSAAPSAMVTKNAHWWVTPRRRGLAGSDGSGEGPAAAAGMPPG